MRDIRSEQQSVNKWHAAIGLTLLLGLALIAVGTEMHILSLWITDPIGFWIWQGVWFVSIAFVLGVIVNLAQRK